ncbi:MAG: hypothetical protein IJ089_10100 [Clostridia bacterium]|nr:hypothetical protein [Clostridia bacterium]
MENKTISEYALEVVCTRLDKINHRLVIVLIITIILLFGSNAAWLWAWMQYDYESATTTTETVYTQDGQGTNIIGDNNGVEYGTEQENNDNDPQAEADEE